MSEYRCLLMDIRPFDGSAAANDASMAVIQFMLEGTANSLKNCVSHKWLW